MADLYQTKAIDFHMNTPPPNGIKILAILAIVGGLITLIMGLANLGIGVELLSNLKHPSLTTVETTLSSDHLLLLSGGINFMIGIVNLLFGLGALSLKPWAWYLGIAMQVLGVIIIFVSWFSGRLLIPIAVILLLIYGGVLYYFFQPKIRQAFHH